MPKILNLKFGFLFKIDSGSIFVKLIKWLILPLTNKTEIAKTEVEEIALLFCAIKASIIKIIPYSKKFRDAATYRDKISEVPVPIATFSFLLSDIILKLSKQNIVANITIKNG